MLNLKVLIGLVILNILSSFGDEIKLSLGGKDSENSTFIATEKWQEIKPGQKVPQGLHYRMNLQTGKTEAKLLDPNENEPSNQPTSIQSTNPNPDDSPDIEPARQRLEEALKNIPADKFDDITEEKWKELSKQHRTYEQIKADLKDIELIPKTEAEVMQQLIDEFHDNKIDNQRRLDILKDLEYLMHSIDNALLFISGQGLEKILIPNLVNQTDATFRVSLLKMAGALMQNNFQAKKYVSEKTNLGNEVLNLLTRAEQAEELSSGVYTVGSLTRNNKILSTDVIRKSILVLLGILSKSSAGLAIKSKGLILIADLIHENPEKVDEIFVKNQKICEQISSFFDENRNFFVIDADSMEKAAGALLSFECCKHKWAETPMFRHTLLVLMSSYKARLNEESDEILRFMYELIVEHLENLNGLLYGDLRISEDDLSQKYQERDEL